MDTLLHWLALALVGLLRILPLRLVARLGRLGGASFYWLDARHRQIAFENLTLCFGDHLSPGAIHQIARENFRRIGENFCGAVKCAFMTAEELRPHFEFAGAEKILPFESDGRPQSRVVALGHFGNFELYTRFSDHIKGFTCGTTYRGVRQPALDALMRSLRERSGCRFFERRTDAAALKAAMSGTGLLLGLLADQHAGHGGARLPFLGQECATTVAPAVFALRYRCPLHTAICYRIGLARWRIEVGNEIPTQLGGEPRAVVEITSDINRAFEQAVRRDPANWFWVHNRWKPARVKAQRLGLVEA